MGINAEYMGSLEEDLCWATGYPVGSKDSKFSSKKNKKDFMMKFLLVLFLSTSTLAMPTPQEQPEQTWSAWAQDQSENLVEPLYEVKDQVMQG